MDEARDKKDMALDISEWSVVRPAHLPAQYNGYDCGVFAMLYLNYGSEDIVRGRLFGRFAIP